MHHPTDRIAHTTAFVTPVVEHWLEQEIAQCVHPMKDRSDDLSHHERMLLPRSYISLQLFKGGMRNSSMGPLSPTNEIIHWGKCFDINSHACFACRWIFRAVSTDVCEVITHFTSGCSKEHVSEWWIICLQHFFLKFEGHFGTGDGPECLARQKAGAPYCKNGNHIDIVDR